MTIARIWSGGLSLQQIINHTDLTNLDINMSHALDKTGDTVSGAMDFVSTAAVNFESGSTWLMKSGSGLTLAAGSALIADGYFFLNATSGAMLLPSGTTFTADTATVNALTVVTGPIALSSPATIVRTVPLNCFSALTGIVFAPDVWNQTINGTYQHAVIQSGSTLIMPLRLPHGATLTSISVYYQGASGHAGTVGAPFAYHLLGTAASTGVTSTLASATDVGTLPAYEAYHPVTQSMSILINAQNNSYALSFDGETSTNSIPGGIISGVSITLTIPNILQV